MNYDVAADKFAMGATQGVAGGAMGMALGGFNALAQGVADEQAMKDQYFQQLKLNNMSQIFNKDMYNYQMNKQFEMWENTNYSAQVEQLKKAGLNPALLYGKGGGMGATTGSASAGNMQSHAGSDTDRMGITLQRVSQGMNMALLASQKANIDADTRLKNTEATKKEGVDTQLVETEIANVLADTNNKWAQNTGIQLDNTFKEIQNYIAGNTKDLTISKIINDVEYSKELVDQIKRNNYISENTKEIAIAKAYQEFDKIAVDIIYTQQQTQESKERIAQKWNELKLGWANLEWDKVIEQGQLEVQITHMRNEQEKNRIMKAFQETDKFFKDQRLKWDKEAFKRRMSFEYINMGVGNAVSLGKAFIPGSGGGITNSSANPPKMSTINGTNPNNVGDYESILPTLLDY